MYHCAVIGNPIAHSKSPEIHQEFAKKHNIPLSYTRILAEKENFKEIVHDFFAKNGTGLNITLPFKEQAYLMAEKTTIWAQTAQAANTLWFANGKIHADNTDGRGLCHALQHIHNFPLKNKNILILGAGGAARGIIQPLLECAVKNIHIINRTHTRAQTLAQAYDTRVCAIDNIQQSYDLILNATSIGANAQTFNLDPKALQENTFCYDLFYGKNTPFLTWAEAHNICHKADGYSMLESQAWLSFQIWFKKIL